MFKINFDLEYSIAIRCHTTRRMSKITARRLFYKKQSTRIEYILDFRLIG